MRPLATILALALSGCISSAPIVPVTQQNQAQVAACEQDATLHNAAVFAGIGLGAVGAGAGTVGAIDSDTGVKTAMAVTGASAAALVTAAVAVANLTASNFANSQCSSVVGPLPTKPAPGSP